MKKNILHIIAAIPLLLFCSLPGWSATYYVSPTGNDSNPGTISQPWRTFQHAIARTNAGDEVYFRGGTYTILTPSGESASGIVFSSSNSGDVTNPIGYYNYPGETPIFDYASFDPAIANPIGLDISDASYINLRGFEIRNVGATTPGGLAFGMYIEGSNIIFNQVVVRNIDGVGYWVYGNNIDFIYCDAISCYDSHSAVPGSGGDGWNIITNGNGYVSMFTECRAMYCSANGWDCNLNDGLVIWDICWAIGNGRNESGIHYSPSSPGNGFNLGHNTVAPSGNTGRFLQNCIAADNYGMGFTENNEGYPQIKMEIYNCVSFNNDLGFINYITSSTTQKATYRNNLAFNNSSSDTQWNGETNIISDHNTWDPEPPIVTNEDFVSLVTEQLYNLPRKSDGSLPDVTFMNLTSGSDLIDAGVNVGLPFSGVAPDVGWIEYSGPASIIPVYSGSVIENASPSSLSIIFNLNLANIIPATSAFTVRVNSVIRTINSVDILDNIVQLSLASPVVYGDVVTVSYTKPGTNPIQTPAGGEAASMANQSVINHVVQVQVPTVITTAISDIKAAWAISGGDVTSDGGAAVTETGICWNTSGNPTTANRRMPAYPYGTLSYTSIMTILNPNTTYYVRAYATNSIGTAYGNQEVFTTSSQFDPIAFNPGLTYGEVTDIEGNIYKTIQIGTLEWMAENLKTTKYNDNTSIPLITSDPTWGSLTAPGYCWANNDETTYKNTYGALYNWYTVNTGKLCPTGWHVSTDSEWTTLVNYLGGIGGAGNSLKESGTAHWTSPNINATNTSGFTALGGGYRYYSGGTFYDVGNNGGWWGSSAEIWGMTYVDGYVNRGIGPFYTYGLSVRCVKGAVAVVPTLTTKPASIITYRSANSGGDIISNGGAPVTERGVCWNTSGNPTVSDNHQTSSDLTDSFINYLSLPKQNTIYYVRAYATNSAGTGYGNEISFKTTCQGTVFHIGQYDVTCFGGSDGDIGVGVLAGGTPPWSLVWTGPDGYTATGIDLHLINAGTYVFTSTDGAGCIETRSTTITQPSILSATVTPTMVTCNGANDGIISITAPLGGYGTYEYSVNGGTSWQDNGSFNGLAPASYNIHIRDAAHPSCLVALGGLTITQSNGLNAAGTITTQTCNSCNDAAINLTTISGGTLPYTFTWTGPDGYSSVYQNIAGLKPGSYSVVVSDSHGCTSHVYFEVINPFMVTNTGDEDEIGTLRYAINYANTHNNATSDLITFNIPSDLPKTIQPVSSLPEIDQSLVIDGFSQPNASLKDLILLIELDGTNAGTATNGLTINSNNCIVKGLIINEFTGNGIQVASGTGNTITANSIFDNDQRGIDLGTNDAVTKNDSTEIQGSNPLRYEYDIDAGQNKLQNFPELKSLSFSPGNVTVSGSLFSLPSTIYTLEFFASKVADNTTHGEGQTYLGSGSVTTNDAGKGTFSITVATMTRYGDVITATATDPDGNTSEFSQSIGGLQDQILSSTKIPFHYQVNGQGVKSIPGTAVVDEVLSAFGNWSGNATSTMSFTNDKTDAPPQYASSSDNINLVSFTDNKFPFSPGILAVTAKTLKIGANDGVAQIMDADIVFNPYYVNNTTYDFGIADNPLYPGFFDIQSVTTHEIGHILGLLHSGVYNSTMWFEVGPGTTLRSLEQDDKSWLSYRYPDNTKYDQAFGSISGNIKYGYNSDPVAGAIVLAVDPSTDLAVVHAYSDVHGNYLIPGLPPGSYRVYIMPLDGDVYGRDLRPGNISSYIYSNTVYTDYPGEFYNNPDGDNESGIPPTPVTVLAGQVTAGIDFITNKDSKPPTVVSVVPADAATNISVLPNILITFSEPVNMNTVTDQTCYLTLTGSDTKIGGKYQPDGFEDRSDRVLFTLPENPLSYQSTYTLYITTGVTDLKANPLEADYTSSFSTGVQDVVYPTIKSTIPEANAPNVFLTEKIIVFFSEPMIRSSVEGSFALTTDNGTVKVDCTPSWDEYVTLTLSPRSPLIEGKNYTLNWTNAATDLAGNGLTAGSISFTTIPVAAPTVTYLEPGTNLTSIVAVETAIVVDFSEPIDAATVNASTFILTGTSQIAGTFEFLNENSRVVFRPAANLTFGQTYSINLTNGIQDVSKSKQNFAGFTTPLPTFKTATVPLKPHIEYIDPPASSIGLEVKIGGSGFDPDPAKNKVTFSGATSSGVDALATSASLTSLTVKIPYGAASGAIRVTSNGALDDQDPNNLTTYIYIGSLVDPCNIATGNTGTGSNPRDGVVDYNGANAYITNSGDNTVSVITDLNTDLPQELQPPIQVGKTPMKIDLNPTGTRAYVTNFDSHTVSVIDLTDVNGKKNQVIETINVGIKPFGVVASGNMVYVANYGSKNVTVINADPFSGGFDHAVANINTGTNNRDIDITVDGGLLVVTGDNGLTLIKMTKTALGFDYAVSNANSGTSTRDATITQDGGTVIVTTTGGDIFFVDIAPGDNFGTAYGNYNPGSNAGDGKITYDGLYYFVTNPDDDKVTAYKITYEGSGSGSGTISSSSGLTLKEYATIPVGYSPEGLAFDPANNRLIVVNSGSDNITRITLCCPAVKTVSDYIRDLAFTVQQLMYQKTLSRPSAGMLVGRINDASLNILRNKTKTAVNNMDTFINKVNSLMNSGKLDKTTGNDLINLAKQIIYMLEHPDATKSDAVESLITGVDQSIPDLITESKLMTIYPNPFNESITIDYEIADKELNSGKVMIQIYDITGRVICNLVNKNMEPGRYSITWNGRYENGGTVSKGIYYIRFAAGKTREVKQIMLIR